MTRLRYLVGLATLVGAALAGWWLIDLLRADGHEGLYTLRLEFRDVRGLRAGADVKHRGVPVGSVRRIELREDGERAVVDAVLEPAAARLVRYGSKFWIVTPRFLGLAQGATGLDTLIRDAYVSFLTPPDAGPDLPSGSQVIGTERPPPGADVSLAPIERGDLVMTLLVPENHDLVPGSRVMFRGIETGELRDVRLADDGSHVQLELRIRRAYRHTVTDRSMFWVARPRLSGALLTGLALQDAAALLSPFIAYHTEPGAGVPVPDGHRVAAQPERPDIRMNAVPATALVPTPPATRPPEDGIRVVRVFYQAVERDFWSPDDEVAREGSGLLLEDSDGRSVVLTTRSTCDGTFFVRDAFGARPDIERESVRVALPEGQVLQATRAWTAPDGVDLAVLVLQDPPPSLAGTDPARLHFGAEAIEGESSVRAVDAQAQALPPAALAAASADLDAYRGACVVAGDRVVGLLGQPSGTGREAVVVPLSRVPEALRPKR